MNETIEMVADDLRLNKSEWVLTKFGDIAIQQKKSVDRNDTYLTRYVKGEHMGSEDLHLRDWGELTDEYLGPAFIRKFEKGDILYGSRRTYLRKVVVAPFEGITSNTTFVIKANERKMDKRLLPFLMMSEGFTEHSIKNSKGSVNPYINWKDIANYEFLLPPKDQQAQLAELLWAMDEVIEREREVLKRIETTKLSLFRKFTGQRENWARFRIGDLMKFTYGSALKEGDRIDGLYSVVTSSGIQGTHNDFITKGPGIVVGRKGNAGQITWVENNFWTTDTAYYVEIKEQYQRIPLRFFYYLLIASNLKKHAIATAVPGLNRDDALMTAVYIPSDPEIHEFLVKFTEIDEKIEILRSAICDSQSLQKSLINQIF